MPVRGDVCFYAAGMMFAIWSKLRLHSDSDLIAFRDEPRLSGSKEKILIPNISIWNLYSQRIWSVEMKKIKVSTLTDAQLVTAFINISLRQKDALDVDDA